MFAELQPRLGHLVRAEHPACATSSGRGLVSDGARLPGRREEDRPGRGGVDPEREGALKYVIADSNRRVAQKVPRELRWSDLGEFFPNSVPAVPPELLPARARESDDFSVDDVELQVTREESARRRPSASSASSSNASTSWPLPVT